MNGGKITKNQFNEILRSEPNIHKKPRNVSWKRNDLTLKTDDKKKIRVENPYNKNTVSVEKKMSSEVSVAKKMHSEEMDLKSPRKETYQKKQPSPRRVKFYSHDLVDIHGELMKVNTLDPDPFKLGTDGLEMTKIVTPVPPKVVVNPYKKRKVNGSEKEKESNELMKALQNSKASFHNCNFYFESKEK